MIYAPTLQAAPAPPFTAATVREWVRLPASGEETTIDLLIKGAVAWAENYCEQPLFGADYQVDLPGLAGLSVRGVRPRSASLTTTTDRITYLDYPATVRLRPDGSLLVGEVPAFARPPIGYRLTYRAGYEPLLSADATPDLLLPADIKLALLLWIDANYEQRANPVREKQTAAETYLRPYKRYSV